MIDSTEIFKSSKLISAKIGVAPVNNTAFAVATNVISGIITSSSFPIFNDFSDNCKAAVALETPIAYLEPVRSRKEFSNFLNVGPPVNKLDSRAVITAFLSELSMLGTTKGTLIDLS